MPLHLTADQVASVWSMPVAVPVMRQLCREEAAGQTLSADRIHIPTSSGFLRILPGVLLDSGVLGYKEFHSGGDGMRYTVHLFDFESGTPLAVMDGSNITTVRTGAMGAVGLEALVDPSAQTVGFIGSGKEATAALEGLRCVLPRITRGWNFSPNPNSRSEFAVAAADRHGVQLEPLDSAAEVAAKADVLITATMTRGKIALEGAWLRPGTHVSSIASTAPEQREADAQVFAAADRIVVDTSRLLEESGDAIDALAQGTLAVDKVVTISDVVAGSAIGRRSADDLTLYKSVGTGLQDVASALEIYKRALGDGIGTHVEGIDFPVGSAVHAR